MSVKEIRFTGTTEEISKAWHAQRDKGVGGSTHRLSMEENMDSMQPRERSF